MTVESRSKYKDIKVSVIIPVYNRANVVCRSLDSVVNQDHKFIELIVIDDGSDDKSWEVVEEWAIKNRNGSLTVIHRAQNNMGAPAARNHGLRLATGKYIQFLDSDDWILPSKIQEQVTALEDKQLPLAVCDFRKNGQIGLTQNIFQNNGHLLWRIICGKSVFISTPLIRSDIIGNHLQWNEKLKRNQDIDFMFKVFSVAGKYIYTKGAWCVYEFHKGSQISDSYLSTEPNFQLRALSLVGFLLNQWNVIPIKGRFMLLAGSIKLWINFLNHSCFGLKNILTKLRYRAIRKSPFSS